MKYLNSHDLLCMYNIGFIYTSFETIKENISSFKTWFYVERKYI